MPPCCTPHDARTTSSGPVATYSSPSSQSPEPAPIHDAFVGDRVRVRCRFGTGRHTAVMKTATARPVSRPEQQDHRHVNAAEERTAVQVEERAVAPDLFHRKIPGAHRGRAIVLMQLVIR